MRTEIKVIAGAGLLIWLLSAGKSFMGILKSFIPSVEGFTASPIWDYKQWSWGYGTAAGFDPNKKPSGTITREKAWSDAEKVIDSNYQVLKALVKKNLNGHQWAALLSFAYNAGVGNAKNIVETINAGTTQEVITRIKKYVYAGGVYNQGLANRREKEALLYQGKISSIGQVQDPGWIERIHPDLVGDHPY